MINLRKNSRAGVSLIIAIVFVSAFLLVIAGLTTAQLNTIRAIGNRENEAKVRYLAESAAELASYAASQHGAGWNLAEGGDAILEEHLWAAARGLGMSLCGATDAVTGAAPCSSMQVIGRAADAETLSFPLPGGPTYSSVPIKGTGDAAEHCADINDPDDACNWNQLYVGQTVEIPLYYEDENGNVAQLDDLDDSGEFLLRIRAHEGEVLFPDESMNADAYRHIEKDPVLVQWTISGTSIGAGGQVIGRTLVARDEEENNLRLEEFQSEENTEISGGRINAARIPGNYLENFIVLQKDHQGQNITSQGGRAPQTISTFLGQVDNSALRLSLVGQPRRNTVIGADSFDPASSPRGARYGRSARRRCPCADIAGRCRCRRSCACGRPPARRDRVCRGVDLRCRAGSSGGARSGSGRV